MTQDWRPRADSQKDSGRGSKAETRVALIRLNHFTESVRSDSSIQARIRSLTSVQLIYDIFIYSVNFSITK